jgi:RNA polymerase sigma-70 factor (ECF subfamily)
MEPERDFDAFYLASRRAVLGALTAMTGSPAEAQDCVQEAYARCWQRWDHVGRLDSPEAWVRTVAWRVATNRWRKATNRWRAHDRVGSAPVAPPSEDTVALVAALRRLPEEQRRAIVLHHLVGLSVDEVSAETSAPSGTVKARLSRGRAALRPMLSTEEVDRARS